MRQNVKAAKRQNKLLGVALTKAQTHKGELEMLSEKIEMQKSVVSKNMVQMPDLIYSPFLPLEQQLVEQRQQAFVIGDPTEVTDNVPSQMTHHVELQQKQQAEQ